MRVSLNTVKRFTDVTLSVDELVAKINQQLGGVEGVVDLGVRYREAVIVSIVECSDHPNADRLHVCKIDDGGVVTGVDRDENGLVQVVCGAPNVHRDMCVVWLPPGSTVPASFDDKEPFVLEARELRGIVSNGMLASAKELAIGDSHEGILEIDLDETDAAPGTSFAAMYGLTDTIVDIENKMFTHRPDCFGQLGVAREIAGIQHHSFTSPEWYRHMPAFERGEGLELHVSNESPELVPRLMAVALKNVTIKPSPVWLQAELVRLGAKPINNVVDATNYVMLLTGQPTHAYDYDKLRDHRLVARLAAPHETATLLNGKSYDLTGDDIVIADSEGPIGLAGIMGGGTSEVSAETTRIVLECANFDMYAVRKSSMRHGVFTDALTRFNKGQSALQNPYVLKLLIDTIYDVAGGEIASEVFDTGSTIPEPHTIDITPDFINDRLGLDLSGEEISGLLRNVEFTVEQGELLRITAPFWRTDIELREDIVEEVGRLYGFDALPRVLPPRSMKPALKNTAREVKQRVRDGLSRSGANEVLTYSFIHEKVMKHAGQQPDHAYRLSNALSPDLQYYRLSLIPSLLDKIHMNLKAGHEQFALFEINKVHYRGYMDPADPSVPNEDTHIAFVIASSDKQRPQGSPYYHARQYANEVLELENETLIPLIDFDLTKDERGAELTAPYEPQRSAVIVRDGVIRGVIGEFTRSVRQAFKLPEYVAGFEVHQDIVGLHDRSYRPLPRFPRIHQDVSLEVALAVQVQDVLKVAREAVAGLDLGDNHHTLNLIDIYQAPDADTKTLTFRLAIASYERTLKEAEVTAIIDRIVSDAAQSVDAKKK